jgi:hypothetical protein
MKIEVSTGEIVDKLTILQIKKTNIEDQNKLSNIEKELNYLSDVIDETGFDINTDLYRELLSVNRELWDIEDALREKERLSSFDEEFISLARKVYITNDKRAAIKKKINKISNSLFTEEKSYSEYKSKDI